MAPPRKTGASASEDPEAVHDTQAKAPNPLVGDPEVNTGTQAKAPRPKSRAAQAAVDPEARHATQAKIRKVTVPPDEEGTEAEPAPVQDDPEELNKTAARAPRKPTGARKAARPAARSGGEGLDDEAGEYQTGQSYRPGTASDADANGLEGDSAAEGSAEDAGDASEGPAGSMSLEGDGLDPVDPELGPRTKALPQLDEEASDSDDEDEDEDANATRAGPPLALEIVAGPDAGKKRKIKGVRLVIGRTPGVDLQLSDQSVSRRHVELIRTDEGMVLKDLKSGNGTKVNGQKVSEKVLEHGDEISIGKTKLKFVDEVGAFMKAKKGAEQKAAAAGDASGEGAAPPEGAEAEAGGEEGAEGAAESEGVEGSLGDDAEEGGKALDSKKVSTSVVHRAKGPVRTSRQGKPKGLVENFKALRPPVRLGIIGGTAIFLLLLIVFAATRKPPPPPIDPNKVAAEEKMQLARNAMRDGNFEEAVKLIESAEELVPGVDKTHQGNKAREEYAIQRQMADVRRAIAEKRIEEARALLAKVGQSVKGDAEKHKVELELAAADIEGKKAKIKELLGSGDIDGARAVLAELPVEQQAEPGADITAFEKKLEDLQAGEKLDEGHRAAAAAAAKRQRDAEDLATALAVVERKFAGGEWDRAASECARVVDGNSGNVPIVSRAKVLQGLIPNFGRSYEEGMRKYRQGQLSNAARSLREAWRLYQLIDLRGNRYRDELAQALAQSSLVQGREALLRNDLDTAAVAFKDATKLDPDEPKARRGLEDVIAKAEDLFQQAYMIRDREPQEARRMFNTVKNVTPPGSTYHEKAKSILASMAP